MRPSARWPLTLAFAAGAFVSGLSAQTSSPLATLQTTAESSHYVSSTRYDAAMTFLKAMTVGAPQLVQLQTVGSTSEQHGIPLAVIGTGLADGSAATVRASGRMRVLVRAGSHGDEVDGTEAALMLVRDLAMGRHPEWLTSVVLLVMPILNADGSEKISVANLGAMNGPSAGVGQHTSSQARDLDRDTIALRSPEAGAFVKLVVDYDPQVTIDLHTAADACAGYAFTYAPSLSPGTSDKLISVLKNEWVPFVTNNMKTKYGLETFYRGRVDGSDSGCGPTTAASPLVASGRRAGSPPAATGPAAAIGRGRGRAATVAAPVAASAPREVSWVAIDPEPTVGANYLGLRNRLALIGSAYARAPFSDRVAATRHFLDEALAFVYGADARLRKATQDTDAELVVGRTLATTARTIAGTKLQILMAPGATPIEMTDRLWFESATDEVAAAEYYVPATLTIAIEMLRKHGIQLRALTQPARGVEQFIATALPQGSARLAGAWTPAGPSITAPAGDWVVRMNQPLARLAFTLLEPTSDSGLAMTDEALRSTTAYPILRRR